MKLPTSLRIGPHDYDVSVLPKEEARLRNYRGLSMASENWIKVDTSMKPSAVVETLLHEINHCIYYDYNVLDEDKEERIVTQMSMGMTQVYRDNPELLVFISRNLSHTDNKTSSTFNDGHEICGL